MAQQRKPAIVSVHGAWHVPEHYQDLVTLLEKSGYIVRCPLLPTCDDTKRLDANMYEDAKLVRSVVLSLVEDSLDVIMLLHSYGGAVGSEALKGLSSNDHDRPGKPGNVVHIIYMCAFMLQVGESVGSASLPRPENEPVERDDKTGTTFLLEPRAPLFYGDLETERAEKMEKLLVRQFGAAMTDTVTYPAWKCVPTTYLRTEQDKVLFPKWQDRQIKTVEDAGVAIEIHSFPSSHSPFLSMPEGVVDVVTKVSDKFAR